MLCSRLDRFASRCRAPRLGAFATSLITVCGVLIGCISGGSGGGGGGGGGPVGSDDAQDLDLTSFEINADSAVGGDGPQTGDTGTITDTGTTNDTGDADPTGDTAVGDSGVVTSDVVSACTKAADCNDGNACTTDACTASKCIYTAIANCAKQPAPCDAQNACPAGGGVCDNEAHACVPCLVAKDCGAGKVCAGKTCVTAPSCKSDVDCKAAGKVCNKVASSCVECNQAGDCGADKACITNQCHPAPPCTTSKECDKVCDFKKSICVDCLSPEDCPAGQTCSPEHLCKPALCTGNACGANNSFFVCKPGGAGYLAGVACNDTNPCTVNTCSADKGCSTKFNAALCDDGDKCTSNDACNVGQCLGDKVDCNDSNGCTNDTCSAKLGCVTGPAFGNCDDGNQCTTSDQCENDKCLGIPKVCEDGNICTKDTCDPKDGCTVDTAEGPCDDKNVCTTNDTCVSGVCLGTNKGCDDNNACTDDKCNVAGGGCVYTNNATFCDDGNQCTSNDKCSLGKCYAGALKNCDDVNACTTDSCLTGACQNANNTLACNDGDPCTTGDLCNTGACKAGLNSLVCNDNVACTDDKCEKAMGGCTYIAKSSNCDDLNVCTEGDKCANKLCVPGVAKTCDDNDACTQNTCVKTTGCTYPADTAKCDDKDLCTSDNCAAPSGLCDHKKVPNCCTKQLQCDDGDSCTDDICAGNQCVHKVNGKCCIEDFECNDNSLCTSDSCLLGKCQNTPLPPTPTPAVIGDFEDLGDMQDWTPNAPVGVVGWSQSSTAGAATGSGALLFGNPSKLQQASGAVSVIVLGPKFTVPIGGTTTLSLSWKQDYVGSTGYTPLVVTVVAAAKDNVGVSGPYNILKKYQPLAVDLSPYSGQVVQIKFTGTIGALATTPNSGYGVLVDDVAYTWNCKGKVCTADSGCTSNSLCSTGSCVVGSCNYNFKCCTVATDCNDNSPCSTDSCLGSKCAHSPIASCCGTDKDCNDNNVCTFDVCDATTKKCKFSGVAECCTNVSQCNDNEACTIDSCDAGVCNFKNTCCTTDKECDDKNEKCTVDKCDAASKKCVYTSTGVAGCCLPTVWKETFDGPLVGWTISNAFGVAKGWQQWASPPTPPGAKSDPGVLYYGDPPLKNFNFGANSGTAKSPKIVLPNAAAKLTLKAFLYMDTEGGGAGSYDDLYIYVWADGVKVATAIWNKSTVGFTTGAWLSITGDLTAHVGKTIELEFNFNTKDSVGNSGLGVLIDDLTVERTCP
ncbi:MAG: hypothetical protein EXR77_14760 [Myxococcales bacterium]|nr:hypothetical protein [Myxococcales bacterium]